MIVKMIVTDLDGTLLRSDKTISEQLTATLMKCRERGIKTVYATARGHSAKVLVPSELFDGFVRNNGATGYIGDVSIYSKLIPAAKARELLLTVHNAGAKIVAECDGTHYGNFDVLEKWPAETHYEAADFEKLDLDIEKIYSLVENRETVELIKKHMPDGSYLYISHDNVAMIMHEEATKAKAVAAIAEYWGIPQESLVAFGDDTNDVKLLKYCGIGVAMGNGLDAVKAVADQVCDTNDNEGITKWIQENVLS